MPEIGDGLPQLELKSVIGFDGSVRNGLVVHPDGEHTVYPLGCSIVVENMKTRGQSFLNGHTNYISCLSVSKHGTYVASGQVTYMGFKADAIIWDYATRTLKARCNLHKVKIEALAFSPSEKYLVTIGGQDDGSVVIWDVETGEALCGSPVGARSSGHTFAVAFSLHDDFSFVTAGNIVCRHWTYDKPNRKIRPQDINMGPIRRVIKCLCMDQDGETFYGGTTTGDIVQVNMRTALFLYVSAEKEKLSKGVNVLQQLPDGSLLAGGGDGSVNLLKKEKLKKTLVKKIDGEVTSIALIPGDKCFFYAGSSRCQIYKFNLKDNLSHDLKFTAHADAINDVAFPYGCSTLFATASKEDIRVWVADTGVEVLRITVPNMRCTALKILRDGSAIVSAWDDGKIRGFAPESGKILFTIHDAHNQGVTALSVTSDGRKFVTGGGEGSVRIWDNSGQTKSMIATMKEHKGCVTMTDIKKNDREAVSCSTDGSCILWDINKCHRLQIMFANSLFQCVSFEPRECQVIASGTDRKINYFECFDGSAIRSLEGSLSGAIQGLKITNDGKYMVTGGQDRLLKVWTYNEGDVTHVGIGHAGNITRVTLSPDQRHVVSVSEDGAILRWAFPHAECVAAAELR